MQRVVVYGVSGSGKTTLASQLAAMRDLTHIELDELFHQPGWTPQEPERFRSNLRTALAAADGQWVTCGGYRSLTWDITLPEADTVVWLDLPKSLVMQRVIRRTLRRAVRREVLWNGNREPLTNFYRWDPEKNIIRWSWTKYDTYREQALAAMNDGPWSHATVHRLSSVDAVSKFLAEAA